MPDKIELSLGLRSTISLRHLLTGNRGRLICMYTCVCGCFEIKVSHVASI